MSAQPIRRWDREIALLAWLTACVSILSFLFYLRRGEILLYGDAVAHINIARRVFDSRTPGLLQLGTVWLPLPAPADDSISALELDVEDGSGRIDSVDGRLRFWSSRDFPAGAWRPWPRLAVHSDGQIAPRGWLRSFTPPIPT